MAAIPTGKQRKAAALVAGVSPKWEKDGDRVEETRSVEPQPATVPVLNPATARDTAAVWPLPKRECESVRTRTPEEPFGEEAPHKPTGG